MNNSIQKANARRKSELKKYRPESEQVVLLEDYDLTASKAELAKVREMYTRGSDIRHMAIELGRHEVEVALMILDQADKGLITPRESGILGGKYATVPTDKVC